MKPLWSGRLAGGLDAAFAKFNRSLPFDRRLLADDLRGSVAWARALGRAAVIAPDEAEALVAGLEQLGTELAADPSALHLSDAEDVHSFVEAALEERIGPLARKLHTGRSRNDQVATDIKLFLKRELAALDEALATLMRALVELAEREAGLPLPGYTHMQRAQPITAGHHALAYVEMLARDRSRVAAALERADTSPLGAGALAGTAFPIDRDELARDLGFAGGPARNSLDAVADRDHVLDAAFACCTVLVHLSRLAEDWIFFATSEAGFLALADEVSTGSSLMPQKKNPDALELVRGKAGRVIGSLQALLVTLKGLPLAYDKDMQEDKEPLFDALDTTRACLAVTARAVRGVRFDAERCRAAARRGHLAATDLADLLVRQGVAFRDAHERVGAAVREALERGLELQDLDRLPALFPELDANLAEALAVESTLARRACVGGTAPERVRIEVERWKTKL